MLSTEAATSASAPEIQVDGRTLARAGVSPFVGAVAKAGDGRALVVQITRLPSGGTFPVCTGVRWRPQVTETPRTVIVTAIGYAPREESGQCVDGLDAPVPLPVTLSAPLGTRRLVDGSDKTAHVVFDESDMPLPTSGSLPDGVRGEPVRWNETSGVATKRWQSTVTDPNAQRDVWISIGPAAGIAAGAPVPAKTSSRVEISGVDGRLWRGGGPYDVVVVRFTKGPRTVEVRTVQERTRSDTTVAALRIARSLD